MTRIAILALSIGICGCATVPQIQTACETEFTTFPAMVSCLKGRVAAESRLNKAPEVKLYTLKADQLAERVNAGTITEADARVELQQLLVKLKHQNMMEMTAAQGAANSRKPTQSTCTQYGNTSRCSAY